MSHVLSLRSISEHKDLSIILISFFFIVLSSSFIFICLPIFQFLVLFFFFQKSLFMYHLLLSQKSIILQHTFNLQQYTYLLTHISTYLSIYLFISPSVCHIEFWISIFKITSINKSVVYLSLILSIYTTIYLFIFLSIYLTFNLFISQKSANSFINVLIPPSFYLSTNYTMHLAV